MYLDPISCLQTIPSTTCSTATSDTALSHATEMEGSGQESRTDSYTAIGGGLGALAVVLALTLVGVVLGWVWHYHQYRKESFQRRYKSSNTITSLHEYFYTVLLPPMVLTTPPTPALPPPPDAVPMALMTRPLIPPPQLRHPSVPMIS